MIPFGPLRKGKCGLCGFILTLEQVSGHSCLAVTDPDRKIVHLAANAVLTVVDKNTAVPVPSHSNASTSKQTVTTQPQRRRNVKTNEGKTASKKQPLKSQQQPVETRSSFSPSQFALDGQASNQDQQELDFAEQLISLVRERRELWDSRLLPKTRTREKKDALWQEVCKNIGANQDIVEKKWIEFRDSFRKAYNKYNEAIAKATKTGAGAENLENVPKPGFKQYYSMLFLKDMYEHKRTLNSLRFPKKQQRRQQPTPEDEQENLTSDASNASDDTPLGFSRINELTEENFQPQPPKNARHPSDVGPSRKRLDSSNSIDDEFQPPTPQPPKSARRFHSISPTSDVGTSRKRLDSFNNIADEDSQSSRTPKSQSNSSTVELERRVFEYLDQPLQQPGPADLLHGKLSESFKKLPYTWRSRLELDIMNLVHQTEERYQRETGNSLD